MDAQDACHAQNKTLPYPSSHFKIASFFFLSNSSSTPIQQRGLTYILTASGVSLPFWESRYASRWTLDFGNVSALRTYSVHHLDRTNVRSSHALKKRLQFVLIFLSGSKQTERCCRSCGGRTQQ